MAIALHHSRAKGTARAVLIGIANHDGDGGAWPSVATLAKYAGGIDARNVQKALARLEQLGEIRRHVNAGGSVGTQYGQRPNLYEFLLRCPETCDRTKNHRDRTKNHRDRTKLALLPRFTDATPGEIATPGLVTPGEIATTPPAETPPEPPSKPTTTRKSAGHSTRARSALLVHAGPCPGRSASKPHELQLGYCIYCGRQPEQVSA